MDYKYDVFISYSRKDTAVADRICAALDKQGFSYFIDRKGIGGGQEFPSVLAEAILGCRIMLYVASANSYTSKFTNNEITFAFNEKPKGSILPYIIDGSRLPVTQRFVFASVNIRTMEEHPIDTVLMQDLCRLLGRTFKEHSKTTAPVRPSGSSNAQSSFVSTYDVLLTNAGFAKLQLVKAVKEILELGLKEAKDLVDNVPSVVGDGVDFATASALKNYLEDAGGTVEIKQRSLKSTTTTKDTSYCVLLGEVGAMKLEAVKAVKEACGLGLKEAKELVDGAPSILCQGISYMNAQLIRKAITESSTAEVYLYKQEEATKKLQELKVTTATSLSEKGDTQYDSGNYSSALWYYKTAVAMCDNYPYYDYDCSRIAYCYYMGYGTTKDYDASCRWYRKGAERGYATAQLNLGVMYQNGYGVLKSYKDAELWYRKSAQQGNETAKKYLEDIKPYL